MCFKGTTNLPLSKDISRIFDETGAYFNATTNKTYTNYIVKCQDDYVKDCILVLSDMLINSVFDPFEYKKELKVVIEESVRIADDGDTIISDMMDEQLYLGTSYQDSIDTLSYHTKDSLKYKTVLQYYKKYYRQSNMVISIVSNLPMYAFVKILKKSYFTKLTDKNVGCIAPAPIYSLLPIKIPYYLKKRNGLKTLHLAIGFRTCSQYSTDKYALNILQNILSGYMMARLFSLLREKNGLTYTSGAETKYFDFLGDFTIFTETSPDKLLINKGFGKGVLPVIIDMLFDLQTNGITQEELDISKKI